MSNREIDNRSSAAPLSSADDGSTVLRRQLIAIERSMHAAGALRAAVLSRWTAWEHERVEATIEAFTRLAQCAADCASAADLDSLRNRQVVYATTVVELAAQRHRALLQLATGMAQAVMDAASSANAKTR